MKIELVFTEEQMKKIEKLAKLNNMNTEDYLKLLVNRNIKDK